MNLDYDFRRLNWKIEHQSIETLCHETARIVYQGLIQLGHQVRLVDGLYLTNNGQPLEHSWLETPTQILETDPRQLKEEGNYENDAMPDTLCAILDKEQFGDRYLEIKASVPFSKKNIKRVSQRILTV